MKLNEQRKEILKRAQLVGLGDDGEKYLKSNLRRASEINIKSAYRWLNNLKTPITSHDIGILNNILER